jgi:hypothetical protein
MQPTFHMVQAPKSMINFNNESPRKLKISYAFVLYVMLMYRYCHSCDTYYYTWKLCSLVDIKQCFRGAYCLHHHVMRMEAVSVSKMLVSIDETTMCNIAEDSHLHTRCCENLTSSLLLKAKDWHYLWTKLRNNGRHKLIWISYKRIWKQLFYT